MYHRHGEVDELEMRFRRRIDDVLVAASDPLAPTLTADIDDAIATYMSKRPGELDFEYWAHTDEDRDFGEPVYWWELLDDPDNATPEEIAEAKAEAAISNGRPTMRSAAPESLGDDREPAAPSEPDRGGRQIDREGVAAPLNPGRTEGSSANRLGDDRPRRRASGVMAGAGSQIGRGRFFLATGEVVQRDDVTGDAYPRPSRPHHPPRPTEGPAMADSTASPTGAQRFIEALNALDHMPTWTEAASLGVQLVELSDKEFAVDSPVDDRATEDSSLSGVSGVAVDDVGARRAGVAEVDGRPYCFFVATGEVVYLDHLSEQWYQSGWWYDQRTVRVTTPHGDRIHRAGSHPDAAIHPTAFVDPTARVEAGATVGPHVRIARHAHIARDAAVGAHGVIQDGAWIGTNAQIGQHAWVSHGATVEPHCTIGHHTTIGAGSTVKQGAQVEPYSRLGAGTTTSTTPRNHRGVHIANAVENIMRLDRE